VFGWLFRDQIATTLVGSMWFVPLLLQYYLMFPFALRLLKRAGPWQFMLIALAITFISRGLLLQVGPSFMEGSHIARTMTAFAPFRLSEFAAGMVIGWLLVHKRAETSEYTTSPIDIGGLVVIAFLLQMAGAVLGPRSDVTETFADPMIGLGMAIYALPLLFKAPGRLERSVPARALVFMGVISFPVLIVNDGMRYMASFLRVQEIPDPAWWFFLVVVYVPVGVLIAYPYALLFGLVPRQRRRREPVEAAPSSPLDLQPAPGGGGGS
jgi:peptidoglycan/LPS O-acetylase OafA/YrhL